MTYLASDDTVRAFPGTACPRFMSSACDTTFRINTDTFTQMWCCPEPEAIEINNPESAWKCTLYHGSDQESGKGSGNQAAGRACVSFVDTRATVWMSTQYAQAVGGGGKNGGYTPITASLSDYTVYAMAFPLMTSMTTAEIADTAPTTIESY